MVFKLKTSKSTMVIFEELGASIRLQPFALAKLALALSIRDETQLNDEDFRTDNEGLELNRQTITGEYDDLFKALIIYHTKRSLEDEEYFPKYMKAHLDRGAGMLYNEYRYSGSRFYKHLVNLDESL